jgi:hypothetical protein
MGDNVLSLNKHKENVYSFKITAEGISTAELTVYFYINTSNMRLMFKCNKVENDEYTCTIPILEFIKKTAYNCGLFVQTNDGYFFEPFKGSINVTSGVTVTGQPSGNIAKEIKNAVSSEPSQATKKPAELNTTIIPKLTPVPKPATETKPTPETKPVTDTKPETRSTPFVKDLDIDKIISQMDKIEDKIEKIDTTTIKSKKDLDIERILSQMDKIEGEIDKVEKKEDKKEDKEVKPEPKKEEKPVKEMTVANKNEQSVSAILTELGITVKKPKGIRMPASIKSKMK